VISINAMKRVRTLLLPDTVLNSGSHRPIADCHRCGWKQELRRVGRRDRRVIGALQGHRWICDDCITDLTRAHSTRPLGNGSVEQPAGLRADDRSVA
jgi:hypothetical protein